MRLRTRALEHSSTQLSVLRAFVVNSPLCEPLLSSSRFTSGSPADLADPADKPMAEKIAWARNLPTGIEAAGTIKKTSHITRK
jgi:hypothetical protein